MGAAAETAGSRRLRSRVGGLSTGMGWLAWTMIVVGLCLDSAPPNGVLSSGGRGEGCSTRASMVRLASTEQLVNSIAAKCIKASSAERR
jgi:hypothetical protein